ncbi:helix-turn-helix domain-containing protein [Patescibacteria group bacterium]
MENLLNVNQVAFILKVHPLSIRRYIRENKLKAVKVGGNVRIKESELNSFTIDFTPRKSKSDEKVTKLKIKSKEFSDEDPFIRLKGRGAGIKLGT